MGKILPQVEHIVVVMLENRSLDNMLGWLYADGSAPAVVLPNAGARQFDGLHADMWNPANAGYFTGEAPQKVMASRGTACCTIPDPDPEETFDNVTYQLYGPQGVAAAPSWPMQGFVLNYAATACDDPTHVMQCHDCSQVPVLAALARQYAVSDAWFAPVPSQTWPNRAFAHAGTSNGRINNGSPPDPFQWDVPTIYNVLQAIGSSWSVYSDTLLTPSLTRTMFPKLWDPLLNPHFSRFTEFVDACASDTLPAYSFIEPCFMLQPNDQHPPHDIQAGEAFLHEIWTAVSTSPGWNRTLLIITYDEHGGCYDHVLPPAGAQAPDAASCPGDEGFGFDRFGVRVPAVLVSPYIAAGTVFRSDNGVPYDHTSILATLRDWIGIASADMLPSKRIAAAPTLQQVLTLATARTDLPSIAVPSANWQSPPLSAPLNDLQKSLVSGSARRFGLDPAATLSGIQTRQHAVDFFKRRPTRVNS
ncbi:alkaline phosphatase family protein [Collimonas sp.]|uniref:alkaline phosphatase family protein n=1 Tax=Collimonas sp. TaxID=1963772 RepID=UPI002BDB218D|nr:alkaline phosphatase family protein [Collimonas sp.]HWX00775.1 alkaline phosphatase family protein [Collimonas sp.]